MRCAGVARSWYNESELRISNAPRDKRKIVSKVRLVGASLKYSYATSARLVRPQLELPIPIRARSRRVRPATTLLGSESAAADISAARRSRPRPPFPLGTLSAHIGHSKDTWLSRIPAARGRRISSSLCCDKRLRWPLEPNRADFSLRFSLIKSVVFLWAPQAQPENTM